MGYLQGKGEGILEPEAGFEGGFEVVNVVKVVDGVGGLGLHPVVPDEEVNDFAEVAGGFDVPGVEDEHSEQAPFFECEQAKSFAEGLACDVAWLTGGFSDGVAEAFVNESYGLWVVSVVLL